MLKGQKRLIIKMCILTIASFVLYYFVDGIASLLGIMFFHRLPSVLLPNFIYGVIPLLKLIPLILFAVVIWNLLSKVKTNILLLLVIVLALIVLQPVRIDIGSSRMVPFQEEGDSQKVAKPAFSTSSFKIVKAQYAPGEQLEKRRIEKTGETVYISPTPLITGECIKDAETIVANSGYSVTIFFSKEGVEKWSQVTENNQGKHLAIVMAGKILGVFHVYESIESGTFQIPGPFTKEEAHKIVQSLMQGKDNI